LRDGLQDGLRVGFFVGSFFVKNGDLAVGF